MTQSFDEVYEQAGSDLYYRAPSRWLVELSETADFSDRRALDVGCGDGRNSVFLASKRAMVLAVDCSQVAVTKGAKLAFSNDDVLAKRIIWLCADISYLTFPKCAFELIVCSTVLDNLSPSNAKELVARLVQSLSVGGFLFLAAFTTKDPVCPRTPSDLAGSHTLSPHRYFVEPGLVLEWTKDLHLVKHFEGIEEDRTHGALHFHGIERLIALKT